jgi:hypothetical protein
MNFGEVLGLIAFRFSRSVAYCSRVIILNGSELIFSDLDIIYVEQHRRKRKA